jgi:8-oxo-dGTP diphosphatase
MRRHSVSAGAVVEREDGRVLAVQRRDTGAWVTPGGIVEPGEPLREAAAREVYEETGVTVEIRDLAGIYQNLSTDVVTFVFSARPRAGEDTRISDETTRARWLTLAEADEVMTPAFATRVRDALDHAATAVLRTVSEPHIMAAKNQPYR